MVKLLSAYGYTRYKRSYQHTISTILDGQWMVLCWSQSVQHLLKLQKHAWYWSNVDANRSFRTSANVKNMDCLVQNCVCIVVVAWTQSSCSIYGINLAAQCVGCISFCVVSCYSTRDPSHLGNHTFLDHSSQGNFDELCFAVRTVNRFTWIWRKYFSAGKMLTSVLTWLYKVSLLKNCFLWHYNEVLEVSCFYHKLKCQCGKSPHYNKVRSW